MRKEGKFLVGLLLGAWACFAQAAITPAGTVISNTATLNYEIDGVAQPPVLSDGDPITPGLQPASFRVDELIDLNLAWQDAAPVSVNSPDSNDALTFLLSNIGNGPESFSLTRVNSLAGDSFDPINGSAGSIYLENGLQPGFQFSGPNADTLYIPGVNNPLLAPGASQLVYINSDMPAALANGNTGLVRLTAAATTPGAAGSAPGTILPGAGTAGVDAVVGTNQAQQSRNGAYLVSGLTVVVAKTVLAPPALIQPGSILNYQISVTVSGSGTAANLVINDPMPPELNYTSGSLQVNGAARTDAADADNGQFVANTLTVSFGNTAAPITHLITFSTTVK